jgi:methionine synthase II (cobalamin-independent)
MPLDIADESVRYHLRYKTGKAYPKDVYANDQEYFADIAKAYQTELQILYDAGLRNAQVDDPNLACTRIPSLHTSKLPMSFSTATSPFTTTVSNVLQTCISAFTSAAATL